MDESLRSLIYGIGAYLVLMALLIYYLAFYRLRPKITAKDSSHEIVPPIAFDCTVAVFQHFKNRALWMQRLSYIISWSVLMIFGIWLAADFFLYRNSTHFVFISLVAGLLAIGILLGYLRVKPRINRYVKSVELAKGKALVFEVNGDGVRIPALLLMNPAAWRATDQGVHEITIPLSDIEKFEVFPAMGQQFGQYKVTARGASTVWGAGQLGSLEIFNFGIGIRRDFLQPIHSQVTGFLSEALGERFINRANE